jgi:hypothetical protein
VIADRGEPLRHSGENTVAKVVHRGQVAVSGLRCTAYLGAGDQAEPLVAETDPEDREFSLMQDVVRVAEVPARCRPPGARRDHRAVELSNVEPVISGVVVGDNDRLHAVDLCQELIQVVGVGVVVVDQQRTHGRPNSHLIAQVGAAAG